MSDQDHSFREEAKRKQTGFLAEFLHFAFHNKKWWLVPILVLLLLIGILVVAGGSAAAPFIYSLF